LGRQGVLGVGGLTTWLVGAVIVGIKTSVNVFVARLCSERDGLRAQVGVGVGGKQESQGAATEHDKGVTPVLFGL